jgi:hypothetical protein
MPSTPANQRPQSLPAGYTSDPSWGPLWQCGAGNPFFYNLFEDDFDGLSFANYTTTATGGSVASAAGDGGLALFTTAAGANSFASIQSPAAFVLPSTGNNPPATSGSMKKLFYLTRVQIAHATTDSFIAGLCITTATPFTTGVRSVVDGLFFYKAPGAANNLALINIASNAGSPTGAGFTNTFTIPTSAYTLANNSYIDLAFFIDRNQNLYGFVGFPLVGWIPQSGSGAADPTTGLSLNPPSGPVVANYNYQSQGVQTPIMFTTVNLAPTLAVSNGVTAAVTTMTADFHGALKER